MATESTTTKKTWEDLAFLLFGLMLVGSALERLPGFIQEKTGIDVVGTTTVRTVVLVPPAERGTTVRARMTRELVDAPVSKTVVGILAMGESARIEDGPREVNGIEWWKVRRLGTGQGNDEETEGWLEGRYLDRVVLTRSGGLKSSLSGAIALGPGTPLGTKVRTLRGTDVFSRPGGGITLGFLAEDSFATLRGGPETVGSARWWFVFTENDTEGWVIEEALESASPASFISRTLTVVLIIGALLSLLFLFGIAYVTFRTNQIRAAETRRIKEALPKETVHVKNERWERIVAHVSSGNPSDWRLAIIEADIMLDELMTRIGYVGPSLGEKLKQVSRGDFETIDAAWEAHKIRNRIAHAGSDFILTQREARRVIELYASVFNEFKYV